MTDALTYKEWVELNGRDLPQSPAARVDTILELLRGVSIVDDEGNETGERSEPMISKEEALMLLIKLAHQLATMGNKPDERGVVASIELSRRTYFSVANEARLACSYPNPFGAADVLRIATNHGFVRFEPAPVDEKY